MATNVLLLFFDILEILLRSLPKGPWCDARVEEGPRKSRWRIGQSASFLIESDLGCLAWLNISSIFES